MADLVFEDIIGSRQLEEEFLEKCYCPSGALSQYALISKSLLEQRYTSLFPEGIGGPMLVPASLKKGVSPAILAESISRRPILILGDVGVGKTIFFRHFIHVEAKELFANAIILYIDFGAKGAFAKDMPEYIVDEIQRQLFEKCAISIYDRSFVHAVYHGELLRFDKGIYGSLKISDPQTYESKVIEFLDKKIRDPEHYIKDSLDHITKGRNQQVVIFLDNADQRSDDFQQELFVMSESMATNWSATVFLALRPETFQRSQQNGAMSAYHLKAFTIAPPRVDIVLAKRLAFGLEITSGRLKSSILPQGINVDFQKVGTFLNIVKISLDQSTDIVECIDNLSGGNVRSALDSIKRLIGSGHIDTRLILEKYDKSGRYIVSLHQFLRTMIYGDNVFYDPDSSPIYNIFDITSLDKREHFLSLILLAFIDRTGQRSSRHGFVGLDELYDFAQGLGYLVNQVDEHIGRLWKKRLIETSGRVKPIDKDVSTSSVRITTIGAYHFRKLPRMFVYYDAVITDTPILDRGWRERILDVNDINDRLNRGDIFLSYLNTCFPNMDPAKCGIEWPSYIADARANIKAIKNVLWY